MTLDPTSGDVAAALDSARDNVEDLDAVLDEAMAIARRDDVTTEILDFERYQPMPSRARGTVTAFTAEGFVTAYRHRTVEDGSDDAVIYANPDTCTLVAVLDDDHAGNPGWRQHRIRLDLKPTPEWQHWTTGQGLGPQNRFAEVIEEGEAEIINPTATVMLDLAQTFHASVGAKFRQHGRLRDGRTQFTYEEDLEATAGDGGELTIPDTFTIAVRPFYGADQVEVTCRLRYRLERGQLVIGYQMVRPDEVRRISFATDVLGYVREQLATAQLIEGVPATEVIPPR